MSNNLNTRSKKVTFLKGLQAGTRSIDEIRPLRVEIWEDLETNMNCVVETISGNVRPKNGFNEWMASRKDPPASIVWANV